MVEVFSIYFQEAKALFHLGICGNVDAKFGLCYTASQKKKKKKMQAASFVGLQLWIQVSCWGVVALTSNTDTFREK